jgi:hypothetical protein
VFAVTFLSGILDDKSSSKFEGPSNEDESQAMLRELKEKDKKGKGDEEKKVELIDGVNDVEVD